MFYYLLAVAGALYLVSVVARILSWYARDRGLPASTGWELLAALTPMFITACVYLGITLGGAATYRILFPPPWAISESEAVYYAIQSVTTTGYGAGLTPVDEKFNPYPETPPGAVPKIPPEQILQATAIYRERFFNLSSILMLLGTGGFGFLVSAIPSSFRSMRRRRKASRFRRRRDSLGYDSDK